MQMNFEYVKGGYKGFVVPAFAGRISIGRDPDATIKFDGAADVEVSTKHAEVFLGPDGRPAIVDLESKNGTFVNGTKVEGRAALETGAMIQLGKDGPILRVTFVR